MSEHTQKIKSGRIPVNASTYVGENGTIFYDQEDGILRLSNGQTPGGIVVGNGSGGSATIFDGGSSMTPTIIPELILDMGASI